MFSLKIATVLVLVIFLQVTTFAQDLHNSRSKEENVIQAIFDPALARSVNFVNIQQSRPISQESLAVPTNGKQGTHYSTNAPFNPLMQYFGQPLPSAHYAQLLDLYTGHPTFIIIGPQYYNNGSMPALARPNVAAPPVGLVSATVPPTSLPMAAVPSIGLPTAPGPAVSLSASLGLPPIALKPLGIFSTPTRAPSAASSTIHHLERFYTLNNPAIIEALKLNDRFEYPTTFENENSGLDADAAYEFEPVFIAAPEVNTDSADTVVDEDIITEQTRAGAKSPVLEIIANRPKQRKRMEERIAALYLKRFEANKK